MNWLSGLFQFFRREKMYAFLFFFVVLFLALSFFLRGSFVERGAKFGFEHELKATEEAMKEHQNAAYLKARFEKDPVLGLVSEIFTTAAILALFTGIFINVILIHKTLRGEE